MKRTAIAVAFSVTALTFGQDPESLLVGESGLNASHLSRLVAGRGMVQGTTRNGYFRVRSIENTPLEELRLALRSIRYVLPGNADKVDASSLASVRTHATFLEGAFAIQHGRTPRRGETSGAEFYRQLESRLIVRVDPDTGRLDTEAMRRGVLHRDRMPAARGDMLDPGQIQAMAPIVWKAIGPSQVTGTGQPEFGTGPLSGPKNGAAIAPTDPNTIYVASAGGGVWKSTNAGTSFAFVSQGWTYLNTACVAVDPTNKNIVYAGIGDAGGFLTGQTLGIMKSVNGGTSWTLVGTEFGDSIVKRILVDPDNPTTLIALVTGVKGDIWRSTDSGETWARTNAANGDWQDIDRASNGRLVAVGSDPGIATSSNFGASWSAVIPPLLVGGSVWDVAVSKLDAGRWYLITSNNRIYRTLNLGILWLDITLDHDLGCSTPITNWSNASQGLSVECGIAGLTDRVYTGLRTVSASATNGLLWGDVTNSNLPSSIWAAGQRFMQVHPTDPNKLVLCGAGGFAQLDISGSPSVTPMNGGFDDVMFNGVAVNPTDPTFLMGGSFGLGTPANLGTPFTEPWRALYGTSGAGSAYDFANPGLHYTSGPDGEVYRYTSNNDLSADDISPGGGSAVSPLVCAGPTGSTLVFGAANGNIRVFNGTSWSNHATANSPVRVIAVSKFDKNRIYVGLENGDVFRANSVSGPFVKIDANLPDRPIGGIAESPYSADLLLVALQGMEADSVYRCSNAAAQSPTWIPVNGSGDTALPAVGANDVEFDPVTNVYYAANDLGVFVSPDAGVRWFNLNAMGLPNLPVNDLTVASANGANYLFVGTMGRGIWRLTLGSRFLTSILIFKPAIYGGQQNTITIKLNGSAPVGSVTTMTDGTNNVSMPNTVTFPLGSTQQTFTAFTVDPAATEVVTVTGRVYGTTATNSFVLHKVPNFTYTPADTHIYGGDKFQTNIDLNENAPITTVLTFADNSEFVASPASTSIALGDRTKTVTLHSLPVQAATSVQISARIANTIKSSNLTLHPRPDLTELSVSPSTVVGGTNAIGMVATEFAGLGGAQTVSLTDTSAVVTTPGNAVIPNGANNRSFTISTAPVTTPYTVTIRANLRGTIRTTTLVVTP